MRGGGEHVGDTVSLFGATNGVAKKIERWVRLWPSTAAKQ